MVCSRSRTPNASTFQAERAIAVRSPRVGQEVRPLCASPLRTARCQGAPSAAPHLLATASYVCMCLVALGSAHRLPALGCRPQPTAGLVSAQLQPPQPTPTRSTPPPHRRPVDITGPSARCEAPREAPSLQSAATTRCVLLCALHAGPWLSATTAFCWVHHTAVGHLGWQQSQGVGLTTPGACSGTFITTSPVCPLTPSCLPKELSASPPPKCQRPAHRASRHQTPRYRLWPRDCSHGAP